MSKRGSDELVLSPTSVAETTKRINTQLSPTRETMEDSDEIARAEAVMRIQRTAPEWFVEAFAFIVTELNELKTDKVSLTAIKTELEGQIQSVKKQVSNLQSVISDKDKTIASLQDEIVNLDSYSRRDNLLIEGLDEQLGENIVEKVQCFFTQILALPNANNIKLTRVHRIGKPPHLIPGPVTRPRAILVRFHYYPDRDAVFKASWAIRDGKHFVNEDFPQIIKSRRRKLFPCFKAAKANKNIRKCSLKADKLFIDGRYYSVNDINNLPYGLSWAAKGERFIEETNSTYFFGKDCYLSNFYPTSFKEEETTYCCSEQYYLAAKAFFFEDEVTARAIMRSSDPRKMKGMSYSIKHYNEEKWRVEASRTMERACLLKFSQNDELYNKLCSTVGSFVECNKSDNHFSCGLALSDPNITDSNKWIGKNHLGKILEGVRNKLQGD